MRERFEDSSQGILLYLWELREKIAGVFVQIREICPNGIGGVAGMKNTYNNSIALDKFRKWTEKLKKEDNRLINKLNPFYEPLYDSSASLTTEIVLMMNQNTSKANVGDDKK